MSKFRENNTNKKLWEVYYMEMVYYHLKVLLLVTVIVAVLNLFLSKAPKTKNRVFKLFLLWFLVITVGIGGIWNFIDHVFVADMTIALIENPFRFEVGIANLSLGILGLLCWKLRNNFWTATGIAFSIFYLGTACGHIITILQTGQLENAGLSLWMWDIIIPVLIPVALIRLLVGHKITK